MNHTTDGILIMSVNTGYQGQEFDKRMLEKIENVHRRLSNVYPSSYTVRGREIYVSMLDIQPKDQLRALCNFVEAGVDGVHIDAMKDYISLKPEYKIGHMHDRPGGRNTMDHMGPEFVIIAKEFAESKRIELPVEVHMMTLYELDLVKKYLAAGANRIIMHQEAKEMPYGKGFERVIDMIRYEYYGQFYLAFEPDTLIRDCVFDTVSEDTLIAVDGGINPETASLVIDAGATHLIAASAITKDWEKCSIEELRNRIDSLKGAEYPITR